MFLWSKELWKLKFTPRLSQLFITDWPEECSEGEPCVLSSLPNVIYILVILTILIWT